MSITPILIEAIFEPYVKKIICTKEMEKGGENYFSYLHSNHEKKKIQMNPKKVIEIIQKIIS